MNDPTVDILTQAASDTQKMLPEITQRTTFGPQAPNMIPPVRYQPPDITYGKAGNEFQTVSGRKRADKEALMHGIASMVKSASNYLQDKKQRTLTLDLKNLFDAQEGLKEAQAALQANPNDAAAKEGLQKNIAIINAITSDPKKLKMLQKAFDVDLFGTKNGKNKLENGALVKAWTDYQQKKAAGDKNALNPNAQRLMAAQPWRQQISPELQIQAELIKSGILPKADSILKAYQENYKTLQSATSSADRTKAMEEHNKIISENAKLIAGVNDKRTQALLANALMKHMTEEDRFKTLTQIQGMKSRDVSNRIQALEDIAAGKNKVLEDAIDARKKIAADTHETAEKRAKAYQESVELQRQKVMLQSGNTMATQLNAQRKTLVEENTKLQHELDAKGTSIAGYKFGAMSDKDAQAARAKILMNIQIMNGLDQQLDMINRQNQSMKLLMQTVAPQTDFNAPTGLGSESDPMDDPSANDDEENN